VSLKPSACAMQAIMQIMITVLPKKRMITPF
jgi:hypothetical protein